MNPEPPVTNASPRARPRASLARRRAVLREKRRTPWKGPVAHHSERDQDSPRARRDTPGIGGLTPVVPWSTRSGYPARARLKPRRDLAIELRPSGILLSAQGAVSLEQGWPLAKAEGDQAAGTCPDLTPRGTVRRSPGPQQESEVKGRCRDGRRAGRSSGQGGPRQARNPRRRCCAGTRGALARRCARSWCGASCRWRARSRCATGARPSRSTTWSRSPASAW